MRRLKNKTTTFPKEVGNAACATTITSKAEKCASDAKSRGHVTIAKANQNICQSNLKILKKIKRSQAQNTNCISTIEKMERKRQITQQ